MTRGFAGAFTIGLLLVAPRIAFSDSITPYSDFSSWQAPAKMANGANSGVITFDGLIPAGQTFYTPSPLLLYGVEFGGQRVNVVAPSFNAQPYYYDRGTGPTLTTGFANAVALDFNNPMKAFGLDLFTFFGGGENYGKPVSATITLTDGVSETFKSIPTATDRTTRTFVGFVATQPIRSAIFQPMDGQLLIDNVTVPGAPGAYAALPLPPDSVETCADVVLDIKIKCTTKITYRSTAARAGESLWYDPPAGSVYQFNTLDGSRFVSIDDFPTGFGDSFQVVVGDQVLGQYSPGSNVMFPGGGVTSFTLYGDGTNSSGAFPLQLTFDRDSPSFDEFIGEPAGTPEPGSMWLLSAGLLGIALKAAFSRS